MALKIVGEEEEEKRHRCKHCNEELLVNVTMMVKLQVFCPNENCSLFVDAFWVDRKTWIPL